MIAPRSVRAGVADEDDFLDPFGRLLRLDIENVAFFLFTPGLRAGGQKKPAQAKDQSGQPQAKTGMACNHGMPTSKGVIGE